MFYRVCVLGNRDLLPAHPTDHNLHSLLNLLPVKQIISPHSSATSLFSLPNICEDVNFRGSQLWLRVIDQPDAWQVVTSPDEENPTKVDDLCGIRVVFVVHLELHVAKEIVGQVDLDLHQLAHTLPDLVIGAGARFVDDRRCTDQCSLREKAKTPQ